MRRARDRQAAGRALAETFGSIEHWQDNSQAMRGMRGIGWVILYQDPFNGRWKPILVMDVWERAWSVVDKRLSEATRARTVSAAEQAAFSGLLLNLELERVEAADEAVDRVDDTAFVDEHVVDLHRPSP
jgi:hypothetical protein